MEQEQILPNQNLTGQILIVEDDEAIRSSLSDFLVSEGYEVSEAANGRIGLSKLSALQGQVLILLDLMMPIMNGYEFAEALAKESTKPPLSVVVMSASREGEKFAQSNQFLFLKKPLEIETLLQTVSNYFKNDRIN
jgi:CheY-like chemotaxis protein